MKKVLITLMAILENVQYPNLTTNEICVSKYSAITESVHHNSSICGYEIQGTLFPDDNLSNQVQHHAKYEVLQRVLGN